MGAMRKQWSIGIAAQRHWWLSIHTQWPGRSQRKQLNETLLLTTPVFIPGTCTCAVYLKALVAVHCLPCVPGMALFLSDHPEEL